MAKENEGSTQTNLTLDIIFIVGVECDKYFSFANSLQQIGQSLKRDQKTITGTLTLYKKILQNYERFAVEIGI